MATPASSPPTGLILTGGGARAAYQVGVLRAIARLRADCGVPHGNPFTVLVGTSAGAINAAALAAEADDFSYSVTRLVHAWQHMHVDQIYRADSLGVIRSGAGWLGMLSLGWLLARWYRLKPRSLLDNQPLAMLLQQLIRLERVPDLIAAGHLQALAISASSYSSGQHVTFYEADHEATPWTRSQRVAVRAHLGVEHLLASSAIPFVFAPTALPLAGQLQWFGDGSMRQAAPIAPAIHLGAQRVLVIGAGRMHEPPGQRPIDPQAPSIAQIAGHALSNIFLDALAVDIERLERINRTLGLLSAEARQHSTLRPIEVLVIAPSQRLDDVASRHLNALPLTIRALLGGVGVGRGGVPTQGSALASYLLFEADYTRELMDLGEADTLARRDAVCDFLGWNRPVQRGAEAPAGGA